MPLKIQPLILCLFLSVLPSFCQEPTCHAGGFTEPLQSISRSIPFWTGIEVSPEPIDCIQRLKAVKGQKLVLVEIKEQYLESSSLCVEEVPNNPNFCSSSYSVQVLGPSGQSAQVTSTTNGLNPAPGDWDSEMTEDGVLRSKITATVIDVSQCTVSADCEFEMRIQMSGGFPYPQRVQALEIGVGPLEFKLIHSPFAYFYWPEDSRESGSVEIARKSRHKQCFMCPVNDGKSIKVQAAFVGGSGIAEVPKYKITFELGNPSGVVDYRDGTSSNFGNGAGSGKNDPDFRFTQEANEGFDAPTSVGQSIQTSEEVDFKEVTVTSFDYGGVTLIRAKINVDGVWIYADSTDVEDDDFNLLPKAACAVDSNDKRGFQQIPIDVDCNWIADSWEKPKATRALGVIHFPKYWDGETSLPTTPASVTPGDGYGAYDEYRGFHTVNDSDDIQFERTDGSILDSFYVGHQESGAYIGKMKIAVKSVLEKELPQKTNSNGDLLRDEYDDPLLSVKLHNLRSDQYSTMAGTSVQSLPLNKNTEEDSNPINYPILLVPSSCPGQQLGITPVSGKSDQAIKICVNNIAATAGNDGILENTLISTTVAHEIGHRYNLKHYTKKLSHYQTFLLPSQLLLLPSMQYAQSLIPPNGFYLYVQYYSKASGAYVELDTVSLVTNGVFNPLVIGCELTSSVISPAATPIDTVMTGIAHYICSGGSLSSLWPDLDVLLYKKNRLMTYNFFKSIDSHNSADHKFSESGPNDVSLMQLN
ncbi:MAG: hypothetical protein NTW74_02520 [Acidobacteria bacterium]|nr:hypothetical protein [Acidobacteriota bacterium]